MKNLVEVLRDKERQLEILENEIRQLREQACHLAEEGVRFAPDCDQTFYSELRWPCQRLGYGSCIS